jgi:thiol-disulfide isomerase/thioredoxin
MKNIYFLFIITAILLSSCKTTRPVSGKTGMPANSVVSGDDQTAPLNYADQTTWLLGYFNPDQLTHYPYSTWYLKGFDEYDLKTEPLNKLLEINKDDISIKVVMGTWCPDSRREVPRFMKILDAWKFPAGKVTFIGVDDAKRSPVGEYIKLGIERVPTFIIYKNNIEAGRIIENPVTSLEQDMVNILTGMNNNK